MCKEHKCNIHEKCAFQTHWRMAFSHGEHMLHIAGLLWRFHPNLLFESCHKNPLLRKLWNMHLPLPQNRTHTQKVGPAQTGNIHANYFADGLQAQSRLQTIQPRKRACAEI